jgi:hypothetical protein
MNHSTSQYTSLVFEPDSVYLLFVKLGGWCCAGVFHHDSDNMGTLAYAGGGILGPPRPHRRVILFERILKQSKFSHPELFLTCD